MIRQREVGVDVYRILAMFFIMLLHFVGAGGILGETDSLSLKYAVALLLFSISFCGVNCFGLLSGYVNLNAKYKYSNMIMIWLSAVWYSGIGGVIYKFSLGENFPMNDLFRGFFPITNGSYWYVNAYLVLFMVMPILSASLVAFSKRQIFAILIVGFILISVYQTVIIRKEVLGISGYSALWLVYLYLVGGTIKKYGENIKISKTLCILGFAAMTFVIWGIRLFLVYVSNLFLDEIHDGGTIFARYTSPFVLGQSIFLLLLFQRINFDKCPMKGKQMIIKLAPLTFGAYLIQTQPVFFNNYWVLGFSYVAQYPVLMYIGWLIFVPILFYIGCIIVDKLRSIIFEKIGIRMWLNKQEAKYIGNIW